MTEHYRVADFIADFIADLGVRHVFLLPGGGAMHLNDGIAKNTHLQAVPCLHEQACVIAAEAYSRISGCIGVAMVTTGPGGTNAITGVAGAWIESIPLLVISGQVKRADMLSGSHLRQKGVQEVDIVSMVTPITKYAVTVLRPEDIRIELEHALAFATSGRAGPVWIDVPLDVQAAPIDRAKLEGYKALPSRTDIPTTREIEGLCTLLAQSQRPLILVGHGVRLANAAEIFREFAEALNIPVVTTWNALDLLPYAHHLCVGRPGVVALRAPNFAVQNCDLLLSLGSRLDNIMTAYNPRGFARSAKHVVVDVDRNEIEKLDMVVDLAICSDADDFIRTLLPAVKTLARPDCSAWRKRCLDWKQRYRISVGGNFPAGSPISHYQFVDALSEVIPLNTLVSTGSSGLGIEVFYTVFRNKPGQRVFLTSGLGAMGYGLPAAIGACFANGRKPMIAIESDGSLQLNIQELATLRGFNLPICLLVMNNHGYASIRNTQRNYFAGRYLGTGPEAGLWLPDLEEVARAYQLSFLRIRDAAQLTIALTRALALRRPMLVDVQLIADEALAPKVSALPQSDGSMLSMPLEDMSPLLPLEVLQHEMLIPLDHSSLAARCNPLERKV